MGKRENTYSKPMTQIGSRRSARRSTHSKRRSARQTRDGSCGGPLERDRGPASRASHARRGAGRRGHLFGPDFRGERQCHRLRRRLARVHRQRARNMEYGPRSSRRGAAGLRKTGPHAEGGDSGRPLWPMRGLRAHHGGLRRSWGPGDRGRGRGAGSHRIGAESGREVSASWAIFSFNGNKIITTSGGGMLVSNDPEVRPPGEIPLDPGPGPAPHYQHSQIGYNYRMSNLLAAVGRGQLARLPEKIARRKQIGRFTGRLCGTCPGSSSCPTRTTASRTIGSRSILIDPVAFRSGPRSRPSGSRG